MFHALSRDVLARIVDLQVTHLSELLAQRGLGLVVTPAARGQLADEGYDLDYGARPLKRVLQRRVQDPLAMAILTSQFPEGDTVRVDWRDEAFVFESAGAADVQ
jgi:ATP-dependent Clp protease ATP-binding subunit ClpB